ncbi:MAG: portal protein [Plesiomonas shigelloides]
MAESQNDKLVEIMTNFDRDWSNSNEVRTDATNDIYFCRITQWDDWLQDYTTLQYRGQFDVLRKEIRRVISEMRKNPIEVMYRPLDDADPDAADTLMGMYRADMRNNSSLEAVNIAVRDQIECGYGAWRLVTEYEDDSDGNANQVIRRVGIHEAATHVVWDANCRRMDKSDARHCTVITGFSVEGWKHFAKENGLDPDEMPSFQKPDMNWQFQWVRKDCVYVGEYYELEKKKDSILFYENMLTGETKKYYKSEVREYIEELAELGFDLVTQKKVTRTICNKYLMSGYKILKGPERIAGGMIPVVPVYGEWAFAGDKEIYEGLVRLAKDPQRLRNMIMSYSADIVAKTPKKKPFFYQEQVQGYEFMYESDAEYPYYLLNRTTMNGEQLPPGAIAYWENPEVPQASQYMLQMATEAVKEVTTEGVNAKDIAGQQVAFDTVNQLNLRTDMEWFVYLDNLATAKRRDGEIYASIAAEIYDVPRKVKTRSVDGKEADVMVMDQVIDIQAGSVKVVNDIRQKFEVYTDVGPSYQSMKDQYRSELGELYKSIDPTLPVGAEAKSIILLQIVNMMDGAEGNILRDWANKQLLTQGLKEPEDEEEQQIVMQAQQAAAQQQDPNMVIAQAQMAAAQAEMQKAQNEQAGVQIKAFAAQSDAQFKQAQTVKAYAEAQNISKEKMMQALQILRDYQLQQMQDQSKVQDTFLQQ